MKPEVRSGLRPEIVSPGQFNWSRCPLHIVRHHFIQDKRIHNLFMTSREPYQNLYISQIIEKNDIFHNLAGSSSLKGFIGLYILYTVSFHRHAS